jgi:hypothetical protein
VSADQRIDRGDRALLERCGLGTFEELESRRAAGQEIDILCEAHADEMTGALRKALERIYRVRLSDEASHH